jgi:superfamily II DNA/RNA helicase
VALLLLASLLLLLTICYYKLLLLSLLTAQVGEEESTHQHVPQSYIITSLEGQIPHLAALLQRAMAADAQDYKIIVFFTTARLTQFYAELCNLMGFTVLEIHSRKSQVCTHPCYTVIVVLDSSSNSSIS